MKVSVIIPVYNAAAFMTQAVESALAQPETGEVLLVEDGSPDNALEVCEGLAGKYERVRLLRHPNGENRGAGASRNLGMLNAGCELIAFLDADDYYLPERFRQAAQLFETDPLCDGVYEAVGMQVSSDDGLLRWQNAGRSVSSLQTMDTIVEPERLAESLLDGKNGYFHLNGMTFKKQILARSGLMDEGLKLHQDTEFILRVAMTARLLPGRLNEPVAMWRVHPANRISAPRSLAAQHRDHMRFWLCLYRWTRRNGTLGQQRMVREAALDYNRSHKYFVKFPRNFFPDTVLIMSRQLRLLAYPELWLDRQAHPSQDHRRQD